VYKIPSSLFWTFHLPSVGIAVVQKTSHTKSRCVRSFWIQKDHIHPSWLNRSSASYLKRTIVRVDVLGSDIKRSNHALFTQAYSIRAESTTCFLLQELLLQIIYIKFRFKPSFVFSTVVIVRKAQTISIHELFSSGSKSSYYTRTWLSVPQPDCASMVHMLQLFFARLLIHAVHLADKAIHPVKACMSSLS
jgi:hypothetical protein